MGRCIGEGQVLKSPDWRAFRGEQDTEKYVKSTLGGNKYFLLKRGSSELVEKEA